MLFTGEYEHTIDAKLRLAIPAEIRGSWDSETLGDGFYVAPGSNGAVWLWPQRTFEAMAGALEQTFLPDEDTADFEELMFSQAARRDLDTAGRIRIPDRLIRFGSLGTRVILLGVKDHLELRDAEAWERRRDERLEQYGEIMLRARRALAARQQSNARKEERP